MMQLLLLAEKKRTKSYLIALQGCANGQTLLKGFIIVSLLVLRNIQQDQLSFNQNF